MSTALIFIPDEEEPEMCITAHVSSLPGEVAGDDLAAYFEAITEHDIDHSDCEMLGGGKARVKLQGVTPTSKQLLSADVP